jgi:uncharacterized membrane protein YvbJ
VTEKEFLLFNFSAHGLEAQMDKSVEEARELIEAVEVYKADPSHKNLLAFISESVDGSILSEQVEAAFPKEYGSERRYKISRQATRMGAIIERDQA